jgi:hypothetical protein
MEPDFPAPFLCSEKRAELAWAVIWQLAAKISIQRRGEPAASSKLFYSISVENHCSGKTGSLDAESLPGST